MSVIPIYKAIQFIDIIPPEVGHTQPWIVAVMTPEGLLSYIVKLYTPDQVETQHCVTKEIIGNALAKEFDFLSQNGFVDFSVQITGWLNNVQSKSRIFVDYLKRSLYE